MSSRRSPGPEPRIRSSAPISRDVFRDAALEDYQRETGRDGALLRNAPGWTRWTYWVLMAGAACFVLFGLFGRVSEYAGGPAVVRMADRSEVAATVTGIVRSIVVSPGDEVEAGDPLGHFHGEREAAESRRLRALLDARMRQYLQNLDDAAAQAAVIQARRELELAETRLRELSLRAPEAGIVGDVWVEVGEHVTAGQPVLSLETGSGGCEVLALLPGRYRPLLAPGQVLRLELQGYPFQYRNLVVESVNDQVLGPEEARQVLGPTMRDGLSIPGPVVVARARLPGGSFELDGRSVRYHDGMLGFAEVPVRSEPLFASLIPGLDAPPWRSGG